MSVDGNNVWAFGDGDYGKLGIGNSTSRPAPTKVEGLSGHCVKKIGCGTQFSVVLTRDGKVFTWGQGRLHVPSTAVYSTSCLCNFIILTRHAVSIQQVSYLFQQNMNCLTSSEH